jgi:hypothetical protein
MPPTRDLTMNRTFTRRLFTLSALSAALWLAACGGSDDDTSAAPAPAPPVVLATQVTGSVVKGPLAGAEVCGFAVEGSARGAALGSCVTTDAEGNYTLSVPVGSGPLWLEATGGTYTDEATGVLTTLPAGVVLTTLATANGGDVSAVLTPLTTLALNAARAAVGDGALDAAAFEAAATALLATFGLPATLDLATEVPAFGEQPNAYGEALTIISRMVAAGLALADLLATADPAELQAAYAAAAAPTPPPATPLVISKATPADWNGTLDLAGAQFEHGSGSNTGDGPYDAGQPYCRLAVYGLLTPDGVAHFLQIPFKKTDKSVGLVSFGLDASFATEARELGPLPGMTIDTVNRRITFVNVVIGTGNAANTMTLNGTLDYPTNVAPENRAACG